MCHVLIVEDEIITGMSLQLELQRSGYSQVDVANTESEAIALFLLNHYDIVLMDINLEEGGSGINAAREITSVKQVPVIFVTAYANDATIEEAGKLFPYGYIVKPYDIREIKAVIQTALIRFNYDQEVIKSEAKLRVAVEAAEMGVMALNRSNNIITLDSTQTLKDKLDLAAVMSLEEFLALISEEDSQKLRPLLLSAKVNKQLIRLSTSDATQQRYLEIFLSDSLLEQGNTLVGAVRDVTEHERYLQEIQLSDYIFNNIQESVLLLDSDFTIKKVNPALSSATGFQQHELVGSHFFNLLQHNRANDFINFESINASREVVVQQKNDATFYALIAACSVETVSGMLNYIVMLTDISEIKKSNARLETMAYTDELTALYNRTFMNKVLKQPAQYFKTGQFAIIFVDLDLFKLINDTYGHVAGDEVLKEFAKRLTCQFRTTDYVIRHGGDEFVILVEGEHTESTLSQLANNINNALQCAFKVGTDEVVLTCSIGIAIGESHNEIELMLQQADIAMYEAKNSGRNSYRVYSEHYGEQVKYQLFIEQGLRKAIEQDKLQIWLQPVVNAASTIICFEALCRWHDSQAGFIPPLDFIPVAERSWLVMPMGLLVFKKACQCIRSMQEKYIDNIKINVNLSPKQVASTALPDMLQTLLNEFELTAQHFTLEITENVLQLPECIQTLDALRSMGFAIALDDFGTGYSNLARLKEFPLDIIKIDKSLVQGRFDNEERRIVCDSVLDMCQKLGFTIVVEGIETELHANYFKGFSDVLQQGYFHGKPHVDVFSFLTK